MSDDGNIIQHLNETSNGIDKLAQCGMEIQEELLAIMLLTSLPNEYENLVIAMESRDVVPELFNDLKIKPIHFIKHSNQSMITSW